MPELHSHTTMPLATVRQVMDRGVASCFVPRLSATASRQLASLARALDSLNLSFEADERTLLLCASPSGKFVVSMLYRLCTTGGELSTHYTFVWKSFAPSKVKFFAWLLVQGRVQCRSNLLHQNILRAEESGCPICNATLETSHHIFFGCPFARSFWRELGTDPAPFSDTGCVENCPLPATAPARTASTFRLWHLWKHMNGVVFNDQTLSIAAARKNCRDYAVLWRARLPSKMKDGVDVWLSLLLPTRY
ncbi:unnamed protein product [Alopecurus aequalis]